MLKGARKEEEKREEFYIGILNCGRLEAKYGGGSVINLGGKAAL